MSKDKNIGIPIFASVLRREMADRTWTQEHVALAAGVAQASVNGWLGGAIPRADALYRLARALGVSMEELLTGEKPAGNSAVDAAVWKEKAKSAESRIEGLKSGMLSLVKKF
jgi:transcriptional regulator with XRE-family HTH domain